MNAWTVEQVEGRFDEAVAVMRRLPDVRVPGYFNTWPEMVASSSFAGREDAKLIWARSEGTPWKFLCSRFGIARSTANRRYQYALNLIAWRLNGRDVPTKRSRDFLIERARSTSSAF